MNDLKIFKNKKNESCHEMYCMTALKKLLIMIVANLRRVSATP